MKKKIGVILLSLICLCSVTFAYLTSRDEQTNTFTIGKNNTHIIEKFPVDELDDSIEKVVQVVNEGEVDCYVRVWVGLSDESLLDYLSFDYNEKDWKKVGDYYYYQSILKVGELTTPLFTTVSTDFKINEDFEIFVYEESVQSASYQNIEAAFSSIGGNV